MMGQQDEPQGKLFYHSFQLERRVRQDHPLRRIAEIIEQAACNNQHQFALSSYADR